MTALGMRLALSRLKRAHNIQVTPVTIPFTSPTTRAQVISGYAATLDVDLVRNRFRGWAFGAVHRQDVPLYFKHDRDREVGTIDSLSYDDQGALQITATVTCPLARRANAFSVGCTVFDYELVNADTPDFFARITRASLEEVSLTDQPANPAALVLHRREASSQAELYGHAITAIDRISQIVALLQKGTHHDISPGR